MNLRLERVFFNVTRKYVLYNFQKFPPSFRQTNCLCDRWNFVFIDRHLCINDKSRELEKKITIEILYKLKIFYDFVSPATEPGMKTYLTKLFICMKVRWRTLSGRWDQKKKRERNFFTEENYPITIWYDNSKSIFVPEETVKW